MQKKEIKSTSKYGMKNPMLQVIIATGNGNMDLVTAHSRKKKGQDISN